MLKTGDLAPAFVLPGASRDRLVLNELLAAGPVALFFFKLGCGATDIAAPFVERIWAAYREHVSAEGSRLTVLGIAQEDAKGADEFRALHGLSFPVALDSDFATSRSYDLEATPTIVLLRGVEKLRMDSSKVGMAESYRIADVVEGWSRQGYEMFSEEIAARIGTLPADLYEGAGSVPESRPG